MIEPEAINVEDLEDIACPMCDEDFDPRAGIRAHMIGHGMTDPVILQGQRGHIVVSKGDFEQTAHMLELLCTWETLDEIFDYWRQHLSNPDDSEFLASIMMRAARRERDAARKAKGD